MSNYEDLDVWRKSHELVLEIYKSIACFPEIEKFGLADQLRRSASSIAMNICEGCGRNTKKDFIHFLYMARGSLNETKYSLLLAKDLKYISVERHDALLSVCDSIGKMLNALINRIR